MEPCFSINWYICQDKSIFLSSIFLHAACLNFLDYVADNGVYMFGGYRHGMLSGSPLVNQMQQALVPSAQGISSDGKSLIFFSISCL